MVVEFILALVTLQELRKFSGMLRMSLKLHLNVAVKHVLMMISNVYSSYGASIYLAFYFTLIEFVNQHTGIIIAVQ